MPEQSKDGIGVVPGHGGGAEHAVTDGARASAAPVDTPPTGGRGETRRVTLLSLNYQPAARVVDYAHFLIGEGIGVDLVLPDRQSARNVTLDPAVRVHPLLSAEAQLPIRRFEQVLLYKVPGGALRVARKVTNRTRLLRPLDRLVGLIQRGHKRAAGGVHRRLFMPFYRDVRPVLLARRGKKALQAALDAGAVDRIVAADLSAVPLGCRLARRHPGIPATTVLDRAPYERASDAAPAD